MRTLGVLQMAGKTLRFSPGAKKRSGRPNGGYAYESMPRSLAMSSQSPVDLVAFVSIAAPLCAIACVVVHLL